MTNISYFDYKELRSKVVMYRRQRDINALGEWFVFYGSAYWNGECYDADGFGIFPVYIDTEESNGNFILRHFGLKIL